MQPCWPVGTFASHLVGFDGKPEAKELFAEITLVEFVTEDGLVGCLQFSKGKVLRKECIDGVRVGEFCNEAVVGIFNNCCVVIGSRRQRVNREETYYTVCFIRANFAAAAHIGNRNRMATRVSGNGIKGI